MHPYFELERPVVIGHRGAAATHPENTLLSFEAALDAGAQILESDVHLTRDGIPILLHDPSLERTTNGDGLAAALDWSEIAERDAGYQFASAGGRFPFRGQGIQVARLDAAFAAFPDARFNLEIKSEDPRASQATLDLILEHDRAARTLVTAGEDPIMEILLGALAEHAARPALGACLGDLLQIVRAALEGASPAARAAVPAHVMALQIPADFAGEPLATPTLIDFAHAAGIQVHVWTINDLAQTEALVQMGVDGVITDDPGAMAHWKQSWQTGRPSPGKGPLDG